MNDFGGVIKILKNGGIGVMPTDTIYGLVGSAFSKKAVERIYKVRKRDKNKPFIVLISSIGDLKEFGVKPSRQHLKILKLLWPGPVSIIFPLNPKRPARSASLRYLHRGRGTIAFRLPKDKRLRELLQKTGPLVAPSANIAGEPPAKTINEAKKYFGNKIDFYLDEGKLAGSPSILIEIRR